MNVDEVRRLFSYTEWANVRILECVRGLDGEQFTRRIESSFPTIRDTLAHIVMAEWVWLRRWAGESPAGPPQWAHEPSLETMETNLLAVGRERAALLSTLAEEDLKRELSYRTMNGDSCTTPLGDLMVHVTNHSTYHRGQLTTMLRQAGASPPATDLIVFLRDVAPPGGSSTTGR